MKSIILRYAALTISVLSTHLDAQVHAFTVADDIEMERFSDPRPLPGLSGSESTRPSPNGRWVAIVTTKGIIKTNQVQSTIRVFDMQRVKAFFSSTGASAPKPQVIAQVTSFPHHEESMAYAPVITDLEWSPDSTSIYFRGEDLGGINRLYTVGEDGNGLRTLTPAEYDVGRYAIARDTIVYKARLGVTPESTLANPASPDAESVLGHPLSEILFPDEEAYRPRTWGLWVTRKTDGAQQTMPVASYSMRETDTVGALWKPFVISPQGDKLIEVAPANQLPKSWEAYEPAKGFEFLRLRSRDPDLLKPEYPLRPKVYTLIDLRSGKQVSLINAPFGGSLAYSDPSQVLWSDDGRRVLVTNTFLPLDQGERGSDPKYLEPCIIASVELPSLQTRCLIFNEARTQWFTGHSYELDNLSFGIDKNEVIWRARTSQTEQRVERFHYRDGAWTLFDSRTSDRVAGSRLSAESGDGPESMALRLEVKQSLNEPPTLWVENKSTGTGKKLWDPNPQLAQIRFGEVSVLRWKDKNGREWTGGLVKPVYYVLGKRYPLVLQMYMFDDDQFLTDGTMPTAFAARHLASVGIMVLQIRKDSVHTMDDAEAQEHLEAYQSAIEKLVHDGLADPDRVGVVGFSWTCWFVENALIKAPHLFKAATIADGPDHSYMQYHLLEAESLLSQEQDETIIGTKPIGDGLKRWLEYAPGFGLDRVQTPLRIEAIRPMSVLFEWEIYSSLRMLNRPVDLIYFPASWHIHQRPWARLESQQGDVDWFRFWLQGYEDPDPTKRLQYERWELLRSDRDSSRSVKP
jgi:dipeptidyl aminopeptidase/acylaminoacyl peptidase